MTKESKLTVFKYNCTVAGYSEEASTILGVYYHSYGYQYLLALVEVISL